MELNLSEKAITGWLREPGENAEDQGGRHHHFD